SSTGGGGSGDSDGGTGTSVGETSSDGGGGGITTADGTMSLASRYFRISSGREEGIPKYSAKRRVVVSSSVEAFGSVWTSPIPRRRWTSSYATSPSIRTRWLWRIGWW